MIYEFTHYAATPGRRVSFRLDRAELERVRRAGFLEGDALRGVTIDGTETPGEPTIVMTPAAARAMVDILAMIGGDAAVSARMLSSALDDMVAELRTARAIETLIYSPTEPVGRRYSVAGLSRTRA